MSLYTMMDMAVKLFWLIALGQQSKEKEANEHEPTRNAG